MNDKILKRDMKVKTHPKNDLFLYDLTDESIIKKSEPMNKDEKTLLEILLKTFGDFASIPEISKTLKISKTYLYSAKNKRKFVTYLTGKKIVVLTKTLVHFMRTFDNQNIQK